MNQLQIIDQREVLGKDFKIYGTKEDPLFLAKDVAEWIGHTHTTNMLKSIDEDEKLNVTLLHAGQKREVTMLTEEGLYEVLMQSRKPIAKAFKKEVKAILKQIRKTGGYIPVTENMSEKEILATALLITQKTIEEQKLLIAKKNTIIEEQAPFVEFAKAVGGADGNLLVREVAKLLCNDGFQIGQNELFGKFREWGWIVKKASKNEPTQFAINAGYLATEGYVFNTFYGDKFAVTPKVTPKGQLAISKKLREERIQKQEA